MVRHALGDLLELLLGGFERSAVAQGGEDRREHVQVREPCVVHASPSFCALPDLPSLGHRGGPHHLNDASDGARVEQRGLAVSMEDRHRHQVARHAVVRQDVQVPDVVVGLAGLRQCVEVVGHGQVPCSIFEGPQQDGHAAVEGVDLPAREPVVIDGDARRTPCLVGDEADAEALLLGQVAQDAGEQRVDAPHVDGSPREG